MQTTQSKARRFVIHSRRLTRTERRAVETFLAATQHAARVLADRLDPKGERPSRGVVAKLDAIYVAAAQGRILLLTQATAEAFRREPGRPARVAA
jgi:hypothetical protein